jgi:hypothetical protein
MISTVPKCSPYCIYTLSRLTHFSFTDHLFLPPSCKASGTLLLIPPAAIQTCSPPHTHQHTSQHALTKHTETGPAPLFPISPPSEDPLNSVSTCHPNFLQHAESLPDLVSPLSTPTPTYKMSYNPSTSATSTLHNTTSSSTAGTLRNANQPNVLRKEGIEYARDSIEFWRPVYEEKARRKRERRKELEGKGGMRERGLSLSLGWVSRLFGVRRRV